MELKDLNPGDKVISYGRLSGGYSLERVEKVTATLLVTNVRRYRLSDGQIHGCNGYTDARKVSVITPELQAAHRQQNAVFKFARVYEKGNWRNLSSEDLESMIAKMEGAL